MKGYKVFNPDWICRDFRYEVGKVYEHKGEIELCNSGFHFCEKANDCFNYYSFDPSNKVAEVEALGEVITNKDKSVTNKIKILREISWAELLEIVNIGKGNTGRMNTGNYNAGNRNTGVFNTGNHNAGNWNTGHCNTGEWNTGYRNTGYRNTGDFNTGDCNTGYRNTGYRNIGYRNTGDCNTGDFNTSDCNTGYRNTGYRNTGDCNTGNWNTGNWNTGEWNKTNDSSGCFNTEVQTIKMFDKESNWTLKDWWDCEVRDILPLLSPTTWVESRDMTDEEKIGNPSHSTTGGFLRKLDTSKIATDWWKNLEEENRSIIRALPNYDEKKFFDILGIKEG